MFFYAVARRHVVQFVCQRAVNTFVNEEFATKCMYWFLIFFANW